MREIIFRGKRTDTGEWVYGDLRHENSGRVVIMTNLNTWGDNGDNIDPYGEDKIVSPDTVGQFTGLEDNDGKEIYEGDIVKDKYEKRYEVRYDDKRMSWIAHSTIPFENNLPLCVVTECTIIDNIHDNPELLVEEK